MSKIKIFAVSGSGNGAGKSFLASKLVGKENVISLAGLMRCELKEKYPQYDWFNKDQSYKENTKVAELDGKSVRQVLIDYGQDACLVDPWYWVRALAFTYQHSVGVFAIDDLRKVIEIEFLRAFFGKDNVNHFHVTFPEAKKETLYDNDKLEKIADYVVSRRVEMATIPAAHVPKQPKTMYQWSANFSTGPEPRGPMYVYRALAEFAKQGLVDTKVLTWTMLDQVNFLNDGTTEPFYTIREVQVYD